MHKDGFHGAGGKRSKEGAKLTLTPAPAPCHTHLGQFQRPGAPPREEMVDEVYEDELDLQRSGSYLDSSIASAWSERSLDPGDIRVCAALCASFGCKITPVLPPGLCTTAGPLSGPPSFPSKTCPPSILHYWLRLLPLTLFRGGHTPPRSLEPNP